MRSQECPKLSQEQLYAEKLDNLEEMEKFLEIYNLTKTESRIENLN